MHVGGFVFRTHQRQMYGSVSVRTNNHEYSRARLQVLGMLLLTSSVHADGKGIETSTAGLVLVMAALSDALTRILALAAGRRIRRLETVDQELL